jgi:hypothetical protein
VTDQKSSGIGLTGITSIIKNSTKNSQTITINRTGTATHRHIPSVIVVCEDKLAATAIDLITAELNGSYRVLTAGTWKNMATLLYGMHFYQTNLAAAGDTRFLEVVCVTDGDIPDAKINQAIRETHRGDHVSEDAQNILDHIQQSLVHFNLATHLDEPVSGLPEYHHKIWLEEIGADFLKEHFQVELTRLNSIKNPTADPNITWGIKSNIMEINMKINEVLTLIGNSKTLNFDKKDKSPNYHRYYKDLRRKFTGDTPHTYSIHSVEYAVLKIIQTYNRKRWDEYINPVKEALNRAWARQFDRFKADRFNHIDIS